MTDYAYQQLILMYLFNIYYILCLFTSGMWYHEREMQRQRLADTGLKIREEIYATRER
jgi:hypothetical protein